MQFWLIPLIFLIIFESLADIFAMEYSIVNKWYFYAFSIISYIIANMFWLSAVKNGSGLGRGAVIFSVASAIIAVIIGIFFYNETTNKTEIVGILLGILSIVLIFWE